MFGKFSAVSKHGVRGLWNSWWHQTNRQISSAPATALSRWMWAGASESLLVYMVVVIFAFESSGLLHSGLIPPESVSELLLANEMRLRLAAFFALQAPIFGFELMLARAMQRVPKSWQQSRLASVVTMYWVALCLCFTLRFLTDSFRELRYQDRCPIPFSIIKGLNEHQWRTWR